MLLPFYYFNATPKIKNCKQISSLLQKFSLRADWAEKLLEMTETDKGKSAQSISAFVQESQNQIHAINQKLQRLLDGYLEQDIEREIYREQKTKLLLDKEVAGRENGAD